MSKKCRNKKQKTVYLSIDDLKELGIIKKKKKRNRKSKKRVIYVDPNTNEIVSKSMIKEHRSSSDHMVGSGSYNPNVSNIALETLRANELVKAKEHQDRTLEERKAFSQGNPTLLTDQFNQITDKIVRDSAKQTHNYLNFYYPTNRSEWGHIPQAEQGDDPVVVEVADVPKYYDPNDSVGLETPSSDFPNGGPSVDKDGISDMSSPFGPLPKQLDTIQEEENLKHDSDDEFKDAKEDDEFPAKQLFASSPEEPSITPEPNTVIRPTLEPKKPTEKDTLGELSDYKNVLGSRGGLSITGYSREISNDIVGTLRYKLAKAKVVTPSEAKSLSYPNASKLYSSQFSAKTFTKLLKKFKKNENLSSVNI